MKEKESKKNKDEWGEKGNWAKFFLEQIIYEYCWFAISNKREKKDCSSKEKADTKDRIDCFFLEF